MKDDRCKQIAAWADHYLEELYGGPGSYQFLLLMYQGILDADAMSAWLKVADLCQPNLEQMLNTVFFL
jgi:hypothetical protein